MENAGRANGWSPPVMMPRMNENLSGQHLAFWQSPPRRHSAAEGPVRAPEGLKVGKRYQDEDTGIEVLVTKPGEITLQCNGKDMQLQEPKKTKSAD